jgi:hypothetical protein
MHSEATMRHRSGAVVVIALLVCGCSFEGAIDDGTLSMSDSDVVLEPGADPDLEGGDPAPQPSAQDKITHNGLAVEVLNTALADLQAEARGAFTGERLGSTAAGRTLREYVVACAFGPEDGGVLALASAWRSRPLGAEEGRWLSGCLIAHLNAAGVEVPISARGLRPELEPTPEVRQSYRVQEAAFYGDLFAAVQERFVCIGEDFSNIGDPDSWLQSRLCSWQEDCSIEPSGFCTGACMDAPGVWSDCSTYLDFDADAHDFRRYREVITIYLPERQ